MCMQRNRALLPSITVQHLHHGTGWAAARGHTPSPGATPLRVACGHHSGCLPLMHLTATPTSAPSSPHKNTHLPGYQRRSPCYNPGKTACAPAIRNTAAFAPTDQPIQATTRHSAASVTITKAAAAPRPPPQTPQRHSQQQWPWPAPKQCAPPSAPTGPAVGHTHIIPPTSYNTAHTRSAHNKHSTHGRPSGCCPHPTHSPPSWGWNRGCLMLSWAGFEPTTATHCATATRGQHTLEARCQVTPGGGRRTYATRCYNTIDGYLMSFEYSHRAQGGQTDRLGSQTGSQTGSQAGGANHNAPSSGKEFESGATYARGSAQCQYETHCWAWRCNCSQGCSHVQSRSFLGMSACHARARRMPRSRAEATTRCTP
jgi:hypothetical protein